jgi:hypothetical protein
MGKITQVIHDFKKVKHPDPKCIIEVKSSLKFILTVIGYGGPERPSTFQKKLQLALPRLARQLGDCVREGAISLTGPELNEVIDIFNDVLTDDQMMVADKKHELTNVIEYIMGAGVV